MSHRIAALDSNERLLEALPLALADPAPEDIETPHPISRPWDAPQWLEFISFHLDLHRERFESVVRTPGFSRA